ncbi:MAG: antitoxin [Candidatus Dormibacteraeota bacterium]|nr:antitoxin [Candidatus Dormibacteraeota bacterium]
MRTLYLRNVPDEVVDRLERLAAVDGMSVNAVAVRELAESSRRADNRSLLGSLPDLNVDLSELVADLEAERAGR